MDGSVDSDVAALQREGYVVLPDVLSSREVETVQRELSPYLQGRLMGRNDFEGTHSERVYALLAKAPSIATLVEHPRVLDIVDRLLERTYLLSAALAILVHPGETPQAFHTDDGSVRLPRPRPLYGVSTIWALDDFTASNGATEVIPGSHLWDEEIYPGADDPGAVPVIMSAGSVVVFAGSLFHRGGANTSNTKRLGITPQYCQPWLRQLENMVLAVPPEVASRYSLRVQEMLGYSIAEPSFMGYVDGMHPRRLVDPHYRSDHEPNKGVADVLLGKGNG